MTGKKLLRTAADAVFAKDKAQGSDYPDGYPIPATQYFTNKCAAAANKSPSEGAQWAGFCMLWVDIVFVIRPFGRIAVDVFPDLQIILFAADQVLVVGALPDLQVGL